MASWASIIEEFAKPAHKNVTILIPNITSDDIESLLDAIAEDNHWSYKEIKRKNGEKVFSYQTTVLGQISLSNFQIIEYTLIPKNNNLQLDIESRYIATQNKLALLLYFYKFGKLNEFFDFFGKNRENLAIIINTLEKAFQNTSIIKTTNPDSGNNAETKRLSILSLLIALLKIYYLLVTLFLLYLIILFFIWIAQSYSYILNHKLY